MDATTQKQLLLDYYEPARYQGVTMSSKGTVWRNSIAGRFPFSLDISMDKHIESKGTNLAIVFSKVNTSMVAFDLDGDVDLYEIMVSSYILTNIIEGMGFTPLVYISGGKGLHIEIKMNGKAPCTHLKKLASIIKTLAEDRGCQYIDKVYPSNHAYRMFGCKHYKTNNFTQIFKDGRTLSESESWKEFQRYLANDCRANTLVKVEDAITKYKEMVVTTKPKVKNKQKKEPSPKGSVKEIHYSIENLQQIHTQGLYKNYTRYLTAFQLGRYFKEILHLTEGQARAEIDKWLRRHYKTSSDYFGDAPGAKIKSAYSKCSKETIDNCMRGYACGKSIKVNRIIKFKRKIEKYVDDLKITKQQKVALRYLVRAVEQYNSLTFYQSYNQLGVGFKLKDNATIKAYIDKFVELGVLNIISKGAVVGGKNVSTTYEITIPNTYYDVEIIANDEPEPISQEVAEEPNNYIHTLKRKFHVYCTKTFVHEKQNKNSHKPIV